MLSVCPAGVAISATDPVGVPVPLLAATAALTLAACPCTRLSGEIFVSVVAVCVIATEPHAFTRLHASIVPSPVARSYPAVVVHAGLLELSGSTSMPNPPITDCPQLAEFIAH